jgi:ABC-type Na+ efflux pump permease subunit
MSQRKPPVLSIAAICCPLLIRGVFDFLGTAAARDFNERMFGRYYTLGMLLTVGFYAAIVLGLTGLGLALGVMARRRRETPYWLPLLALATNIVAPLAVLLWLTH